MVEQSLNNDRRSNFAERFDDKLIRRLLKNESQKPCLPIDKYDALWKEIHKIAISVDDLLVFFTDSHRAIFEQSLGRSAVRELKNRRQCLIPGEDELQFLLTVYEDGVRNHCQYLTDSTCMQEHLLDSFCRSDGVTSGVFSCSKYPWVLATPDVATFMVEGKSIIIHCEILQGSDWIKSQIVTPGQPLKTPEAKALSASKRKVQCLMHLMKESLGDLFPKPVAILNLADSTGTIHYQEELAYDPAIEIWLDLACSMYTNEVYDNLAQPVGVMGYGELKVWQQPRKKLKEGSVVFQVKSKRPFPGCFGSVKKIDGNKVYVDWDGSNGSKSRACMKESLRLVPVVKIQPPTRDGEIVAITGGDDADRYGKLVKVVDCRPSNDSKIRVEDATGTSFRVHRHFLHVVKHGEESSSREHCVYKTMSALRLKPPKGVDEIKWAKSVLEKQTKSRYIVAVKTYHRRGHAKGTGEYEPCSSIYFTAPSDSAPDANSDAEEEEIQSIFWSFIFDQKAQIQYMSSNKAFKFSCEEARHTFITNFRDMNRCFENDAIDIFVSYFNFREDADRVQAIPSLIIDVLAGKSVEQQLRVWDSYLKRAGLFTSRPQMLLVPLNQNNIHWTLAVVGNPFVPNEQFLLHIDSQSNEDMTLSTEAEGFIRTLASAITGTNINITANQSRQVQQQEDSHSCGPFVVFFMEGLATEFQTKLPAKMTISWAEDTLRKMIISHSHVQELRKMMITMATGLQKESKFPGEQLDPILADLDEPSPSISIDCPI